MHFNRSLINIIIQIIVKSPFFDKMNAKAEGVVGRANEGQYPMARSQGDIASSDVDSNTAEAVGHVVRLHSTQQKTLCASKHYIGNDFIMDQEFVIDE